MGRVSRKASSIQVSSFASIVPSTLSGLLSVASSSSIATSFMLLRFAAFFVRQRQSEMLRTIFRTKAGSREGFAGGMAFQVPRYASFTHSSASGSLPKILKEIIWKSFPYFWSSSFMPCSERAKNRAIIFSSSISLTSSSYIL